MLKPYLMNCIFKNQKIKSVTCTTSTDISRKVLCIYDLYEITLLTYSQEKQRLPLVD